MEVSKRFKPILKLLTVLSAVDKLVTETLKELTFEIENYQQGQLLKGQLATGDLITPKYKPFTIKQKEKDPRYKAPDDTPNLLNTGDYYDSIMAKVKDKYIDIISNDSKSDDLEKKYTKDILGWNQDTKDAFANEVFLPVLEEKIRNLIQVIR